MLELIKILVFLLMEEQILKIGTSSNSPETKVQV